MMIWQTFGESATFELPCIHICTLRPPPPQSLALSWHTLKFLFSQCRAIFSCAKRVPRYNIGHIGIALGDLGLAYQAFKVAVSVDPAHGEALNNIAVLEMRRQKFDLARSCLCSSIDVGPHLFEPLFNTGILVFNCNE